MSEIRTRPLSATEKMHARAVEMSVERFKNHKLTKEGDGRWFCGKPGDSNCHFRVIVSPGAIFMHGDLYELILLPHDRDALAWLRGTLRDGREIGYPLSKIPHSMRKNAQEFCEELAAELLAEWLEEHPDDEDGVAKVREAIKDDDGTRLEDRWAYAWMDHLVKDCDFPSATTWTPMTLGQLEALRWFVRALAAQEEAEKAATDGKKGGPS